MIPYVKRTLAVVEMEDTVSIIMFQSDKPASFVTSPLKWGLPEGRTDPIKEEFW
jgi:hypothetical protein